MIRGVDYASCYVYSPSGSGAMCERSRLLCALLKEGNAHFMFKYALRVRQQADERAILAGFFSAADVLVPVPSSTPSARGNWPAAHLASALLQAGIGGSAWTGLHRVCAVPKSATAAPGRRPSVTRHYASFHVEPPFDNLVSVLLIDDVVTRGRTLLAAAARVREAIPGVHVRAFALLRTMGMAPYIENLLDPCRGQIRWRSGDAQRIP
jgi:predicted amidophosphoribosyltransferase